jgi:adenosine deaminase
VDSVQTGELQIVSKKVMESLMKMGFFIALNTNSQLHQLGNDVAQVPHGQ